MTPEPIDWEAAHDERMEEIFALQGALDLAWEHLPSGVKRGIDDLLASSLENDIPQPSEGEPHAE